MAAYASLLSLMRVIHDLETHPSPPIYLDKQLLDSITQRITYFQQFLHSYISSPVADDDEEEAADPLEMRIAAAAYSAEDAIEFHIVECNEKANDDEKMKSFNQCCGILQSAIEEMDSIKNVLIKKQLVVHDQVAMRVNVTPFVVSQSESTLVGCDAVSLEIMEKLAGGQLDCQVIPIVGMGGIGKTFLAKAIYAKPFIKEHFDISAWATISQHYDTGEILRELLSQATNTNKEQLSGKSEDILGSELHKYLFGRRFLIVMDDMWSIDSWDKIQRFFPNNCNGSRVLVTTRLLQLSSQLNNNDYSLHMSFLDKGSSWDLFSKTVFGDKSTSCPPELEKIGEEIVDNCRGLPLSIAVVGGILKKVDPTPSSWESIRENFSSVVNMDNDKHCLRLVKLSYNHLSVYLKPCFLYMGAFEEDEEIRVAKLVRLWVSEGFLKPTNGEALETTARGFLQDLIDRNLILIHELGSTGSIKSCKMHDLVRDMCLKECEKEGFYHVIGQCKPQSMNTQQRRVVIPMDTSKKTVRGELILMTHTRLIISKHPRIALGRNLVLLRTLEAHKKPRRISKDFYSNSLKLCFVNLRYLAINSPQMSSFLGSVSRLWNLHTLIVCYFRGRIALFNDFWKMPQFRHVEFDIDYVVLPDPDPPNGDTAVVVMENLHTLKGVRNFKCSEDVVKRIPNIKRLKLKYTATDTDTDTDAADVFQLENIKYLCGLEFITIKSYSKLQNITFPHSIKKLRLSMEFSCCKWDDDMMEKIGSSLPLLEKLALSGGRFGKGSWEIAEDQFPSLKYLNLFDCGGLKSWTAAEEDSSILPRLQHLKLSYLKELKIPFEVGNIDTLKSIELVVCGEGLVKSAKEMFDEQVELQGGEDQLSFHVVVTVRKYQQHLLSLAAPKFYVNLI